MEQISKEEQVKLQQREYMRNWKRMRYITHAEEMKTNQKSYYYKYKFGLSSEEMNRYKDLLPLVTRLKKGLTELQDKNPEFLKEVLELFQ
tara:strand:+ start:197 stop:466 length:270 start_codon:yes stop_codon:yes gene_type:complete